MTHHGKHNNLLKYHVIFDHIYMITTTTLVMSLPVLFFLMLGWM